MQDLNVPDLRARTVDPRTQENYWLRLSLDCVDYPMLCIAASQAVLVSNRAARRELAGASHPLQVVGGLLRAREGCDVTALQRAIQDALLLHRRRLVQIGPNGAKLSVAVVPLVDQNDTDERYGRAVLLMFGRSSFCESLSTDWFARERGLTSAESRVLQGLCAGLTPAEIAARQGVALSTVRTQVRSLRSKTGTASIRELLRQVSTLPPMLNVLRCVSGN